MPLKSELTKFSTASPTLASYSYTDIAEATGIQIFYGGNTMQETTKTYVLFGQTILSHNTLTASTAVLTGSYAKVLDLDFDLAPFNLPKNIKGTAYVAMGILIGWDATSTVNGYVIAKLRHWDGTTETEIASGQTETLSNVNQSASLKGNRLVKMTVPLTHFKKGDTLRLTLEGWSNCTGAPAGSDLMYIYHDPKNRNGTATFSEILEAHIPFNLDL